MNLIQIEDHNEIYNNPAIKEAMFQAIFGATEGKVKSAAQSLYSKQQGLFYVCTIEEEIVGIIGVKQYNNEKLELVHIAVLPEHQGQKIGKWMIDQVLDFTRVPLMYMEGDAKDANYLEKIGFEVREIDDAGLDQYYCQFIDPSN